jgi:phenylacetate-CoA ligase
MIDFRIRDFFSPRRLLYWRWTLWRSQYYPPQRMRALQWKLLSRMLDHCFANVPYYRRLFAELGLRRSDFASLEDLSRIPILTRDVLLSHREEFKADDFERWRPQEIPTTGTTGTPFHFYWDIDSNVLELTCQWRHFSWAGYRLGEPFLDIRSRELDVPNGYKWNWRCRGLEMSEDIINASNIQKYAAVLRRHRIRLWRGDPASIDSLCRLLSEAGIDDVKPEYVSSHGEALLDHQRQLIESWAGVPVCDSYGLKEHNALICQCPEGGYHIAPEYGIVEIIKGNGSPALPGEEGRIVATGLHNRAFPLLRYDTRDYAVQSGRACSCGRALPLIERLTGRLDDRLLTVDGRWVSGLPFPFWFVKGIRKAQLVQEEPLALDVYLVPDRDYNGEGESDLRADYKERLGEAMDIRIHRVEEVPFVKTRKFKFVVSKLKNVPK